LGSGSGDGIALGDGAAVVMVGAWATDGTAEGREGTVGDCAEIVAEHAARSRVSAMTATERHLVASLGIISALL
jgi:hypothetical protein